MAHNVTVASMTTTIPNSYPVLRTHHISLRLVISSVVLLCFALFCWIPILFPIEFLRKSHGLWPGFPVSRARRPVQVIRIKGEKPILKCLGDVYLSAAPHGKGKGVPFPIGSMYAIYGNIYHQYTGTPNVSIYTIHGSFGFWLHLAVVGPTNRSESFSPGFFVSLSPERTRAVTHHPTGINNTNGWILTATAKKIHGVCRWSGLEMVFWIVVYGIQCFASTLSYFTNKDPEMTRPCHDIHGTHGTSFGGGPMGSRKCAGHVPKPQTCRKRTFLNKGCVPFGWLNTSSY